MKMKNKITVSDMKQRVDDRLKEAPNEIVYELIDVLVEIPNMEGSYREKQAFKEYIIHIQEFLKRHL